MIIYRDRKYGFIEYFDDNTGFLARSNIICDGRETDIEPKLRSFPELIDIGIMGSCDASCYGICKAVGVDCYQNAAIKHRPNMSVEQFESIISQCKGRSFQVALGGAGDPNKHEHFERILSLSRENHIVPNLTTSGFSLTDDEISLMKKYCGAVAVSFYSKIKPDGMESNPHTINAIERLVRAGCCTNVHFVLSKQSIVEATYRLKNNLFPKGINAVIFLLYKPVGQAQVDKMLTIDDQEYIGFLENLDSTDHPFKIGFDSCQSPAISRLCTSVAKESLEFCEAARFSMYIDCDLNAFPCSFGHDNVAYSVNLHENSIEAAWGSEEFQRFRNTQEEVCEGCSTKGCRNCALKIGINVCKTTY